MPLGLDEGVTSENDGIDISFKLDKESFNGHYSFNVDYIKKSIKYSVARNEGCKFPLKGRPLFNL